MSATARHAHSVARDRGGLYVIADWWPDGGGVMAWMDPMGSGSIRADGLPLYDFDVDGGRRRLTTSMLTYPAWLATSRPHDEVALIAGGDRELTGANKHVVVCAPRHCRSIPQPKNLVSFDPTWTTSGRLAVVRDRAIPATDNNGGFGPAFSDRVDGSGGIDIVRGAKADPIAGGDGATALTKITMVGNDLKLDTGVGTCGKNGQSVPVGVGQPTLRIDGLTVGGTQQAA